MLKQMWIGIDDILLNFFATLGITAAAGRI